MLIASSIAIAKHEDLARVKRIYVLPMGGGLDQYLANKISEKGKFEIVTDPKAADALLTDRVGENFERKYSELYPPPPPPEPKVDEKDKDKKSDRSDKGLLGEKYQPPVSSFARGRGNVFLVDRTTKLVIWSTYRKPKNSSADAMNQVAAKIAKELSGEIAKK
jgi:hypothetical protein